MLHWIAVTIVSMAAVGSTTTRSVGNLSVIVHQGEYEANEPNERTRVRIEDRDRRTLWRAAFDFSRTINVAPVGPLLFVTGDGARADGIQVEAHVLARHGRTLRDTIKPLSIDSQDGICFSRDGRTLLVAIQTDEECVMCWPKRFELREHVWLHGKFIAKKAWRTKREYKDGRDAARAEGGGCDADVLRMTVFHE